MVYDEFKRQYISSEEAEVKKDLDIDSYGTYVNLSTGSLYDGNTSVILGLSTGGLYDLELDLCNKGDLNHDNILDILDIVLMVNIIMMLHRELLEKEQVYKLMMYLIL